MDFSPRRSMVDLWRWPTLTAAAASIVAPNGTTPSNHGRLLLEIRTPIAIEVEMWQIMANYGKFMHMASIEVILLPNVCKGQRQQRSDHAWDHVHTIVSTTCGGCAIVHLIALIANHYAWILRFQGEMRQDSERINASKDITHSLKHSQHSCLI